MKKAVISWEDPTHHSILMLSGRNEVEAKGQKVGPSINPKPRHLTNLKARRWSKRGGARGGANLSYAVW